MVPVPDLQDAAIEAVKMLSSSVDLGVAGTRQLRINLGLLDCGTPTPYSS